MTDLESAGKTFHVVQKAVAEARIFSGRAERESLDLRLGDTPPKP